MGGQGAQTPKGSQCESPIRHWHRLGRRSWTSVEVRAGLLADVAPTPPDVGCVGRRGKRSRSEPQKEHQHVSLIDSLTALRPGRHSSLEARTSSRRLRHATPQVETLENIVA